MGSDFVEEGRRAGIGSSRRTKDAPGGRQHRRAPGHHRVGTGHRPQEGLREIIKEQAKFKIIKSQTGEFTRAKGKEGHGGLPQGEGKKINVLFAHNDDMAIGAIQAIEEAGMEAGKDIIIVSIDAVKGASRP